MKSACDNIRDDLSAYSDGELTPARRAVVEAHLAACPDCRQCLADLRRLAAGVAALPQVEPPSRFLADVHRKIRSREQRSWVESVFQPVWVKLPLEAVALVAILVAVTVLVHPPHHRPAPAETAHRLALDKSLPAAAPGAPVASARSAPVAPAEKEEAATESLAGGGRLSRREPQPPSGVEGGRKARIAEQEPAGNAGRTGSESLIGAQAASSDDKQELSARLETAKAPAPAGTPAAVAPVDALGKLAEKPAAPVPVVTSTPTGPRRELDEAGKAGQTPEFAKLKDYRTNETAVRPAMAKAGGAGGARDTGDMFAANASPLPVQEIIVVSAADAGKVQQQAAAIATGLNGKLVAAQSQARGHRQDAAPSLGRDQGLAVHTYSGERQSATTSFPARAQGPITAGAAGPQTFWVELPTNQVVAFKHQLSVATGQTERSRPISGAGQVVSGGAILGYVGSKEAGVQQQSELKKAAGQDTSGVAQVAAELEQRSQAGESQQNRPAPVSGVLAPNAVLEIQVVPAMGR